MVNDNIISHPKHYEGNSSIECIDAMVLIFGASNVAMYALCNAFKYLWRHEFKGGLEDLEKASWYLQWADDLYLNQYEEIYEELCEQVEKAKSEY